MTGTNWQMQEHYLESCTCREVCSCLYLGHPTEGTCTALTRSWLFPAWMAALAIYVRAEKLVPGIGRFQQATGGLLLFAGTIVLAAAW